MPPRRQPSALPRSSTLRSRTAANPEPSTRTQVTVTPDDLARRMADDLTITKEKGKEKEKAGAAANKVAGSSTRPAARAPAKPRTMTRTTRRADTDTLAQALGEKLKIEDDAGNATKTPEQRCADAMRAVNAVSRSLSSFIESGWKASTTVTNGANSPKSPSKPKTGTYKTTTKDDRPLQVDKLVITVQENLATLRELRQRDIDVERAASSIVGKLLSLECYRHAMTVLQHMRPHLLMLYPSSNESSSEILSLPLPRTPLATSSDVLLVLLSTYLLHSLIVHVWIEFLAVPDFTKQASSEPSSSLHRLVDILHDYPTLLLWVPHLSEALPKHLDSTLTRAYTALTKSSSLPPATSTYAIANAKALFRMRHYALLLLLHTSHNALKPSMFWDQTVKFSVAYVKAAVASPAAKTIPSSEIKDNVTKTVLAAFDLIMEIVAKREDKAQWMEGSAFVGFCDYWLDFAKRSPDVSYIETITSLIGRTASSGAHALTKDSVVHAEGHGRVQQISGPDAVQAANICAILTRATALLEQPGTMDDQILVALEETTTSIGHIQPYLDVVYGGAEDSHRRYSEKVWRASERLRRACGNVLDSMSASKSSGSVKHLRECLECAIEKLVSSFVAAIKLAKTGHIELVTSTLDSLFSLAKSALQITTPTTYVKSYDLLAQAVRLMSQLPEHAIHATEKGNYLRCISGAFHNIGGVLYQADCFGDAIRFFEQSCDVGEAALDTYRQGRSVEEPSEGQATPEKEALWTQLEEQLFRRWEILAVCHLKTGDRKLAFEAFVNCVKCFPFFRSSFLDQVNSCSNVTLFEDTHSHKHVASIIDRLTYLGVCDLRRPPEQVSLGSILLEEFEEAAERSGDRRNCDLVLGAILERQIHSLEPSRWKPIVREAIIKLMQDALEVYDSQRTPIRRAKILLKYLETLFGSEVTGADGTPQPEDLGKQAEQLLQSQDFGLDSGFAKFAPQHLAIVKLRLAHLVHLRAQTSQFSRVVTYAEEACTILKGVITPLPRPSLGATASRSPEKVQPARKVSQRRAAPPRAATTKLRTRSARTASATPVTPKPRKSTSSHRLSLIPKLSFGEPGAFEDVAQLLCLLGSTAHLLGLLGQVITKVHVLLIARRISERHLETSADDYVKFSVELAHEYVNLGKTQKAASVYNHAWTSMKNLRITDETRVFFFLRYSESLIAVGNVLNSSASYCDAYAASQNIEPDEKGLSTAQRIIARAALLERAAIAATTFGLIQYARDDPVASINGLLQSLRLWNRAYDTLCRLAPPPSTGTESEDTSNPFLVSEPAKQPKGPETPETNLDQANSRKQAQKPPASDGLEWRIVEGILNTLFSLTQAYVARGSPREAEFFAQQAKDLSLALNMPAMTSRALARLGEIYLHLGQLDDCHSCLTQAAVLIADTTGPDAAEIRRLHAEHSRLTQDGKGAQQLYDEAITMLEELETMFALVDAQGAGPRKSIGIPPKSPRIANTQEAMAPSLLRTILRQSIWLLHGDGEEYQTLLDRLRALPQTTETQAEESALMAKLTLNDVHNRFQADMFLSSLAESTLTLPMGMRCNSLALSQGTQDILATLDNAEQLFWSDLGLVARRGNVFHVRDAAVSLALIRAYQTSLGKSGAGVPILAASLLDKATAITLRREILEVVQYKFRDPELYDDLQWPLITPNGSVLPPPPSKRRKQLRFMPIDSDDEDAWDDGRGAEEHPLQPYWSALANKYKSQVYDAMHLSVPQISDLPQNWTVISISLTEDKSTMFVTRQRPGKDPLIICTPLKGRHETEDDEHLAFDDAVKELREIIRLSDEGTRQAVHVKNDREARAAWWADRMALDTRMKELLENLEFCWLGGFKTILSQSSDIPSHILDDLRIRLEMIFKRNMRMQDKKQTIAVRLDDALLECFANLAPKAKDEEIEDLVYFVLDLYQFHGIPVATSEVDIDQVVIDFRAVLEDHSARYRGQMAAQKDAHTFLILDKNVQGIPWESTPILRGQSVSRIPSIDFLLDRHLYAQTVGRTSAAETDRLVVDPRQTYYILNPSGDLKNTEGRFAEWLQRMKKVGWSGIVGRAPTELQVADALTRKDLVIYFGHGGAEQYIRSRKVRHLPRCAATMLWGCSSGNLKEMGDFDRTGTPYNYMLGGCPTLVANLWDVTDRDIDKFSQAVFDKLNLTPENVKSWRPVRDESQTSIVAAVAQSRDACKLKYLTGAAPIIYGIPFYL